jgi:hypothetical protein
MSTTDQTRRPSLLPIALLVLLPVAYVLSYAPVYRIGKSSGWSRIDRSIAAYRPVDWLIDNTPLDEPLYRWADLWGVRGDFVWATAFRAFARGEAGAIGVTISPEAETPHLFEHADTSEVESP